MGVGVMNGKLFHKIFNLEKHTSTGEYIVQCPFHKGGQEEHASAHVNLDKGVFHCKTCNLGLSKSDYTQNYIILPTIKPLKF